MSKNLIILLVALLASSEFIHAMGQTFYSAGTRLAQTGRFAAHRYAETARFMSHMTRQQAETILGVEKNASMEQIKANYRRLAMKYRPDRSADSPERALIKMKEINQARDMLLHQNQNKNSMGDQMRRAQEQQEQMRKEQEQQVKAREQAEKLHQEQERIQKTQQREALEKSRKMREEAQRAAEEKLYRERAEKIQQEAQKADEQAKKAAEEKLNHAKAEKIYQEAHSNNVRQGMWANLAMYGIASTLGGYVLWQGYQDYKDTKKREQEQQAREEAKKAAEEKLRRSIVDKHNFDQLESKLKNSKKMSNEIEINDHISAMNYLLINNSTPEQQKYQLLCTMINYAFKGGNLTNKNNNNFLKAEALMFLAKNYNAYKELVQENLKKENQTYQSKFGISAEQLTPENLYLQTVKLRKKEAPYLVSKPRIS